MPAPSHDAQAGADDPRRMATHATLYTYRLVIAAVEAEQYLNVDHHGLSR